LIFSPKIGTAERLVTLALSQGHAGVLWRRLHHWSAHTASSIDGKEATNATLGVPMEQAVAIKELTTIDARLNQFRSDAYSLLSGANTVHEWLWNYKLRIAVK
jgi:hypothetical protein